MPLPNSENTRKGRDFEQLANKLLEKRYKKIFAGEKLSIGNPAKEHKFDLVSNDNKIVAECKSYAWTETGNVPSAKIAKINEAVLYLLHLPKDIVKLVVLRKDHHSKRNESLAEYYLRINRHLLSDVKILEIDSKTEEIQEIE